VDEAVEAISRLETIDRTVVRATFERRFSVDTMAAKYEAAYARVFGNREAAADIEIPVNGFAHRVAA